MEAISDGLWHRRDDHSIITLWVFRYQLQRVRATR